MRILLYGINFAPEPVGIGKYSGELATWLGGAGAWGARDYSPALLSKLAARKWQQECA
jgi:hypothetical protein